MAGIEIKRLLLAFGLTFFVAWPSFAAEGPMAPIMASGGDGSGGGGAVDVKTEIKLPAEVGLIFDRIAQMTAIESPTLQSISLETRDKLKEIIAKMPLPEKSQKAFYDLVLPLQFDRDKFQKAGSIDPAEYEKITKDYAEAIARYGKKLDESSFVLVAFSRGGISYFLPVFEKRLTSFQQALILLHEFFMRTKTEIPLVRRLELTLRFDSQLYALLSGDDSSALKVRLLETMLTMGAYSDVIFDLSNARSKRADDLFRDVLTQLGRPMSLSELMLNPYNMKNGSGTIYHSLAKQFNAYVPFFAEILNNYTVSDYGVKALEGTEPICSQYANMIDPDLYGDGLVIYDQQHDGVFYLSCKSNEIKLGVRLHFGRNIGRDFCPSNATPPGEQACIN